MEPDERLVEMSDGLPILEKVEGVILTDDDVRRLRDDPWLQLPPVVA